MSLGMKPPPTVTPTPTTTNSPSTLAYPLLTSFAPLFVFLPAVLRDLTRWSTGADRGQQLHRGCEAGETWLWWSCQLPVTLKQCGCRVERGTNTHTLTFSSAAAFNIKTRGSLVSDRICKHQYQKANMWFCICRSSTYLKHIRV